MPNASGRIIFFVFLESNWMAVSMILIPVTTPVRNLERIPVIIFQTAGRQEMDFFTLLPGVLLTAAATGIVH
jgi:hypothetical protein